MVFTFGAAFVRVVDDDNVTTLAPDRGHYDGVAGCDDNGGQYEHKEGNRTHIHLPLPLLLQLYPALCASFTNNNNNVNNNASVFNKVVQFKYQCGSNKFLVSDPKAAVSGMIVRC